MSRRAGKQEAGKRVVASEDDTASEGNRAEEHMENGEEGNLSALDQIIDRLAAERADNQACPDELERRRVLQTMLEFAAAEASPGLFAAITKEIGVANLEETAFLKAYTVYDLVSNSKGDGTQLEPFIKEVESTLINYEATAGKSSAVLNQYKYFIHTELKAHVCLGHLIGPRLSNDGDLAVTKFDVSKLDPTKFDVEAFNESFERWFPEASDPNEEPMYPDPSAVTYHGIISDELKTLHGHVHNLSSKKSRSKALEYLGAILDKHDWLKFVDALRLYVSVLLYSGFDGPALLQATRGAEEVPAPAAHLLALQRSQPLMKEDTGHKKRSHRYNMLVRVYKNLGGTTAGWNSIIEKDEKQGEEMLRSILGNAQRLRAAGAYANLDNSEEVEEEEEDGDADGDAVIDENGNRVRNHRRVDPDDKLYGDIEFYQTDDEDVAAGAGRRAAGSSRVSNKSNLDPSLAQEFDEFDQYATAKPGKRRRKKPIPWTDAETEALMEGIELYGLGHWARILMHFSNVFEPNARTSVSLKDRYRNIEMRKARTEEKTKQQLGV
mmetsp:Transcript_2169/g.4111  ORF Transcript_2169/g.4111 Transcript_2169/m.4111 type:complete len:552 (-) Transcript_2169:29-1684(-)